MIGLGLPLWLKSRWNLYNVIIVPMSTALTLVVFKAEGDVLFGFLTAQKLCLVLVAMNLIPAVDSLDQLFKTTVGSLSALASLMATWLVLFVTFAIALNQIFGLTKLGNNGTDQLNLRTIPKALVLLFRMSCGEGWNDIMHDYAITEPYCTSSSSFFDSDCGSESWAYFLFIAWNIISMYIFVNIVISLVYNNFSYVYQRSGKMSSISRTEIRKFKAKWAEFDDGTGHIPKAKVAKFLSKLDGAFEVRIYPEEFSLPSFMANCRNTIDNGMSSGNLNLDALNSMTSMMDIQDIRMRRVSYKRLYTELMQCDNEKGVPFTSMLLILSHNKFVDENKSLGIVEFLHRRSVRTEVDKDLSIETIVNFFRLLECRSALANHQRQLYGSRRSQNKLNIPSVITTRISSSSSIPTHLTPNVQHSWRIGRTSMEESSRGSSPSPSPTGRSLPVAENQAIFNELLAGSAWSSALVDISAEGRPT